MFKKRSFIKSAFLFFLVILLAVLNILDLFKIEKKLIDLQEIFVLKIYA